MRLQQQVVLKQARVTGVFMAPTEEDPAIVLQVRAALTREVAETFGCRDLLYAGDVPRSGFGKKVPLDGSEIDCEIHLVHPNLAFGVVANKIGGYFAQLDGDGLKLLFKVRLNGYADTAADIVNKVKVDPFDLTLNPAQIPMELHDAPPMETAVLTDKELDTGCVACNNEIPLMADDDKTHVSGSPCTRRELHTPEEAGAPIAPAAVMGGSAHVKEGKRRRAAAAAAVPPPDDDFMSELGVPEGTVN